MSTEAPPFQPNKSQDDIKQHQISQLYQYYNNLIVQQDHTLVKS